MKHGAGLWPFLILSATSPLQAQSRPAKALVLPVTEHRRSWRLSADGRERTGEPEVTQRAGELRLSERRCEWTTADLAEILDFDRDLVIAVDRRSRTYTETPMLARIEFRQEEFGHRRKLAGALDAAKVELPGLDQFFLGAVFGMETDPPPKLRRETVDGESRVHLDALQVASWTLRDEPLSTESRELLERFLWWHEALHRAVRRIVLEAGRVPRHLRYRVHDIGRQREEELVFGAPQESAGSGLDLGGLARAANSADPLEALMRRALLPASRPSDPRARTRAEFAAFCNEAMATSPLDAFLAMTEYGLQSGDKAAIVEGIGKQLRTDPRMKRLIPALNPGPEQREAAIATLRDLDRKDLSHGHVLDIFLANVLDAAGKGEEAERLFVRVLDVNPWLSGVYKDLGDIYHERFDMDRAWRCWDVGRKLAPRHPLYQGIEKHEAELRERFRQVL